MAKSEAYCTKCGSLIQVDDTKPTTKCIFCGSDSDTKQALGLKNDPESRLLLQNQALEQSKLEKEEKKKKQAAVGKGPGTSAKTSKSPAVKPVREITVVKPLPKRIKWMIAGVSVIMIVVISAVFVPLISSRDAKRSALRERFDSGFTVEIEDHAFHHHTNRELWLVTKDDVDEQRALETFSEFYSVYETEYPSSAAKVKPVMKLRIYAPAGLFLCYYQNGVARCDFSTADPSPTPGITTTIGN